MFLSKIIENDLYYLKLMKRINSYQNEFITNIL